MATPSTFPAPFDLSVVILVRFGYPRYRLGEGSCGKSKRDRGIDGVEGGKNRSLRLDQVRFAANHIPVRVLSGSVRYDRDITN